MDPCHFWHGFPPTLTLKNPTAKLICWGIFSSPQLGWDCQARRFYKNAMEGMRIMNPWCPNSNRFFNIHLGKFESEVLVLNKQINHLRIVTISLSAGLKSWILNKDRHTWLNNSATVWTQGPVICHDLRLYKHRHARAFVRAFSFFIALLEPSRECGNSICWRTSLIKINDSVATSSDNFAPVSAKVDWFYYWETLSIANSVVEERHSKFKNPLLLIHVYHILLHWLALNSRDTFSSLWRELNAQLLSLLIVACLMPSVPACKHTPLTA